MNAAEKATLEHAWRYFELHAGQRIAVFNFFVASAGLLAAGLVLALRDGKETATFGLAAGLGLVLLSTVFWKLDHRVSSMIKVSEGVISKIEAQEIGDASLRVMSLEREMTSKGKFTLWGDWTYGQAFRSIFICLGVIGIAGVAISAVNLIKSEPPSASQTESVATDVDDEEPGAQRSDAPPTETPKSIEEATQPSTSAASPTKVR